MIFDDFVDMDRYMIYVIYGCTGYGLALIYININDEKIGY